MKALIFNSGLGKRLGKLTEKNPKCMVKLYNGESIFERQIRILSECGITEFIVTTGPFKEQLYAVAERYNNLNFTFIENAEYKTTNCIFSMYNVKDYLDDDFLVLHGDLVFNKSLVEKMLKSKDSCLCLINENMKLPEKDFKGRIINGVLKQIAVDIFDKDCFALQPLYKLDKFAMKIWINKVIEFVDNDIKSVYAENALNEVMNILEIKTISYSEDYIDEIDNIEDYNRVNNNIKNLDREEQEILFEKINILKKKLKTGDNVFVVCNDIFEKNISDLLNEIGCKYEIFKDFTPNPKYQEIEFALDRINGKKIDIIIAIGGGSSIDVAKCIKAFYNHKNPLDYIDNNMYDYNNIKLIAIPTTAGTGSESTEFAVMYYNNKKYSICHSFLLPNLVILDKELLTSLPNYQKKATLMDSLCQAIESYWSNSSNKTSQQYSKLCIDLILKNYKNYLENDITVYDNILKASNFSGKAINITKTTLPHAISYILSSKYNIAHGHAVSICLPYVWMYMLKDLKEKNLKIKFDELANIMHVDNAEQAIIMFIKIYTEFNFDDPEIMKTDITEIVDGINIERLKNNPIVYNKKQLYEIVELIYKNIKK